MIEVVPYDPNWALAFEKEAAILQELLEPVAIHHFGSTSIPGVLAKPKIDIICVVKELNSALKLVEHGYRSMGELNIPLRLGFAKRTDEVKVNLHVVEPGHAFIEINLAFRDYLREHEEARKEYNALKLELLKDPEASVRQRGRFYGYTLGKDPFIKSILEKAGYNAYTLNFPLHDAEWEAYKGFGLEVKEPCFILYKGTKLVGGGNEQAIEVIDESHRAAFQKLLDQWEARRVETL